MRRISMATRDELVVAIAGRYGRGDRAERGRILDEFTAVTGFHRKHAIRLLRAGQRNRRCGPRPGRRVYDDAVREALIVVWEVSDRIAHSGPVAKGSFVQTLVLTDIATGWTECAPLLVREQRLLTEVLSELRKLLPFALLGLDTDNDSVFMNETVRDYCTEAGIEFTRCRPYRKNDQAWVEQKNGAVVRRTIGYRRFEGLEAAAALARLYAAMRLFVNFFQPSFKLAAKARDGAKVTKRYHPPATPCQRLLADPRTSKEVRRRVDGLRATLKAAGNPCGPAAAR
jgi:hypothetical protein